MSFFETHLPGCSPAKQCARCRLYSLLFKVDNGQLREQLLKLIPEAALGVSQPPPEILGQSIDVLDLSLRTRQCLLNDGLDTVSAVVAKSENLLIQMPNFGRKSLNELKEKLAEHGLYLGMSG